MLLYYLLCVVGDQGKTCRGCLVSCGNKPLWWVALLPYLKRGSNRAGGPGMKGKCCLLSVPMACCAQLQAGVGWARPAWRSASVRADRRGVAGEAQLPGAAPPPPLGDRPLGEEGEAGDRDRLLVRSAARPWWTRASESAERECAPAVPTPPPAPRAMGGGATAPDEPGRLIPRSRACPLSSTAS